MDLEGDDDTILFIWPTTVVHRIDEDSPFYRMSAKDFYKKHYEIIVVLEGIVEPTGMSIQARSSYLGDEILWGYRFKNVLNYADGCYRIDYSSFNEVEKVETPTCSAKHQEEMRKSRTSPTRGREASSDLRSKSEPESMVCNLNGRRNLAGVNHVVPAPHQVRVVDSPSVQHAAIVQSGSSSKNQVFPTPMNNSVQRRQMHMQLPKAASVVTHRRKEY